MWPGFGKRSKSTSAPSNQGYHGANPTANPTGGGGFKLPQFHSHQQHPPQLPFPSPQAGSSGFNFSAASPNSQHTDPNYFPPNPPPYSSPVPPSPSSVERSSSNYPPQGHQSQDFHQQHLDFSSPPTSTFPHATPNANTAGTFHPQSVPAGSFGSGPPPVASSASFSSTNSTHSAIPHSSSSTAYSSSLTHGHPPAGLDAQIAGIAEKLVKEQKMLSAAQAILAQNQLIPGAIDRAILQQCESEIATCRQRIEFLERSKVALMQQLHQQQAAESGWKSGAGSPTGTGAASGIREEGKTIREGSISSSRSSVMGGAGTAGGTMRSGVGSFSALSSPSLATNMDFLRSSSKITSEMVKYRLTEIRRKLETEHKVKAGTEKMLYAIGPDTPPKVVNELRSKLAESSAKVGILTRAEYNYAQLVIEPLAPTDDEDSGFDSRRRSSGRFRIRFGRFANVHGRTSQSSEIYATVCIDGQLKATTRSKEQKWEDQFDIQVDRASDVEIALYTKTHQPLLPASQHHHHDTSQLLSICWFKLADLEDDLRAKYPGGLQGEPDESKLDLYPGGEIFVRMNFVGVQKSVTTSPDAIHRRGAVQKAYPKNGHKFFAIQDYRIIQSQCAVCNEFLGSAGSGYQCANCNYTCHAKCHSNVITKCLTLKFIQTARPGSDTNTGQLLRHNVPHRFELKTNIVPTWCAHCGNMSGPGQRVNKCSFCTVTAHRDCSPLVPHFCGLNPKMIQELAQAFEQQQIANLRKQAEEAEKAEQARVALEAAATVADAPPTSSSPPPPSFASISSAATLSERIEADAAMARRKAQQHQQSPQASGPVPGDGVSAVSPTSPPTAPLPAIATPSPVPPARSKLTVVNDAAKRVSLSDFDFVAVLGRGAFGKVMLAQERMTQKYYAIKALKKEFIIQNDDITSVKLEKRVHQLASRAQHPFLVNLHSAFQTDSRVYFVMEYVSGGDLMCHIQERKRFTPSRARFYAAEVVLALEYFHKNNIVYRDLKLDNILMNPDGHIKVADYGICKENMPYGGTTRTYCGTPDYMAPEILSEGRYGRAVDWWSLGVLLYVMLIGKYPFTGEDEAGILESIMADQVEYPSGFPNASLTLLKGLLKIDPTRRLGGGRLDAEEVKRHPYFADLDWDKLYRKQIPPPWKPQISSATDVSNFDKEFTKEPPVLTPINSVLSEIQQSEFADFDHVADWVLDSRARFAAMGGGTGSR
ncbi:hypothetical protein DFJ73DRAFT_639490 [Zopfochytrium polystomum]|nr:hypothetical protein DFJ73DRAFT_639490 [Zopfochytrium polystomum]